MDNKVFLSADDFESKRLNKSFFTNINKSISTSDLRQKYPPTKFDAFEKATVEKWIKNIYETTGGEIVKGSFNDTEDVSKVLENMKSQASLLKAVIVEDDLGEVHEIYVCPKKLEKAGEDDLLDKKDSIEKAKGDELEKGKIYDSLYYSDLKINFSKTGKEIKEKLENILAKETAKLVDIQSKLDDISDNVAHKPTDCYSEEDGDSLKTYKWEMTYKSDSSMSNNVIKFNDNEQGTLTDEETALYRSWNDNVYQFRSIKREIDSINLLQDNLEDSKKYDLTARQMLSFGF